MSQDLTTRDVFQQVDARLGCVEDDVRGLRVEMSARLGRVEDDLRATRADLRSQIARLRDEMNARFDRLYGLLVSALVGVGALVIAVAGLWLKT